MFTSYKHCIVGAAHQVPSESQEASGKYTFPVSQLNEPFTQLLVKNKRHGGAAFLQGLSKLLSLLLDFSENKNISELIKGKKTLLKQGQDEQRIFRILSGEVYVAREIDDGIVPLARLKKGDFFGNIPFIDLGQEPYSASVFASQDLKLTAFDLEDLQREHDKLSATLKNILAHLATCISVTTLIACDYYKKLFANAN